MRSKNDKGRFKKSLLVPKELFRQNLRDQRFLDRNHGRGDSFGKLRDLVPRFQLKYRILKDDKTVEIFGERQNLQRLLFYVYFSGIPYQIVNRDELNSPQ